jgi:hypothetical protein
MEMRTEMGMSSDGHATNEALQPTDSVELEGLAQPTDSVDRPPLWAATPTALASSGGRYPARTATTESLWWPGLQAGTKRPPIKRPPTCGVRGVVWLRALSVPSSATAAAK